jgi:serine/threonine-protein kinase
VVGRDDDAGRQLIVGTPAYMAPEQLDGDPVDARTDLYCATLVLYRVLVGRPALATDDPRPLAAVARHGPPCPVGVSDDVALVLRVGLAPTPADRFASADEWGHVIAAALAGTLDATWRQRGAAVLARAPWTPTSPPAT